MIRNEQVRLIYENTVISAGVTVSVAAVLSYLQWDVISHAVVLGWLAYMLAVSLARLELWHLYRRFSHLQTIRAWDIQSLIGVGLAALGWSFAGIAFYPKDHLTNQLFLAFVLGGMMVGAASVLAARIPAFTVFIILTGLPTSLRLLIQTDNMHVAMGRLAILYTIVTLITAWRVHLTITSSLKLRFENQDLLASLQKSERRLELALFGADLGLWDWDIQFGKIYWDPHWAAMLGYEPAELTPALSTWEQLICPDDRPAVQLALREHLDGRRLFYESEHRMLTKSGEWKWVLSRGKVVARDSQSRPLRITGTHRDVTERRKTEDALRQSREALESRVEERTAELRTAVALLREEITERQRAEQERARIEGHLQNVQKLEAIGILARGVAHDFNNILTSIAGYTHLAIDDLPPKSPARDHLEQVAKAGERAADLVRRLLIFSRKDDESVRPFEISPVVLETLQLLRASIPSSIDFRQDIDPHCGYVPANPTLLYQIVMNLCTNAYQAMQGSTGCLHVSLAPIELDRPCPPAPVGLPDGPYVKLTVSDSGPGIPAEIADRIFDPFFTTRDVGRGTGLGLSVVHGVVSRCGGLVTFESLPGTGTSFYVYLPRVPADQVPEVLRPPEPCGTGQVLLVDDEESIVQLGSRMLQDLGYAVTAETSSLAAFELFKAKADRFDLLISDLTMPKMTGDELIGKVRKIRPDIPAILISGFHDEVSPADQAGGLDLTERVKKPFTRSDLAFAIQRVLDRRNAHRT